MEFDISEPKDLNLLAIRVGFVGTFEVLTISGVKSPSFSSNNSGVEVLDDPDCVTV
jgi:hypothetical protein